jgi:hypothetical protein
LASDGNCNWKHLHEYLRGNENSPQHLKNYFQWFDMCKRLDAGYTIDQELQHAIVKERDYWKLILYRLCSIVLYLSKSSLTFRGENDKLCTPNNGNFLGLADLLSKYDVTVHEYVRRIISKETSACYCNKTIQNEIISVMASCVRGNILEQARKAKYFSIILGCTPDLSHREQMSFTLRFVDVCESDLIVQDHFITFQETRNNRTVVICN